MSASYEPCEANPFGEKTGGNDNLCQIEIQFAVRNYTPLRTGATFPLPFSGNQASAIRRSERSRPPVEPN